MLKAREKTGALVGRAVRLIRRTAGPALLLAPIALLGSSAPSWTDLTGAGASTESYIGEAVRDALGAAVSWAILCVAALVSVPWIVAGIAFIASQVPRSDRTSQGSSA